jgi:hypothetical protein
VPFTRTTSSTGPEAWPGSTSGSALTGNTGSNPHVQDPASSDSDSGEDRHLDPIDKTMERQALELRTDGSGVLSALSELS